MTTPMMSYRPSCDQTVAAGSGVRQRPAWAHFLGTASARLRPLVIAVGVMAAGATSLPPARADSSTDPITAALNNGGVGNNGSVSNALAGMGQSVCPMLVKPGATMASVASQLTGSTGLPPGMTGTVASMAIQMGCPGFMTSLANGNMPFPLPGLDGNGASLIPAPGLGANPVPSVPFSLPGAVPAAASPLPFPGG